MVGSEDLVEPAGQGAGWWSQSEGQVLMSPVSNNLGSRDLPGLDRSPGQPMDSFRNTGRQPGLGNSKSAG